MAVITETAFRARQRAEALDAGTDYTDADYNELRDDALSELARDVPADASSNISIVSGTKSYPLPAGFITMATSRTIPGSSYFPDDASGTVPVYRLETDTQGVLLPDRDFSFFGLNLILVSAPTANATWILYYGGTYTIATLPDTYVGPLLELATAKLFGRKLTDAAQKGWSYRAASIGVDKTKLVDSWETAKKARQAEYERQIGPFKTNENTFGTFDWNRR